MRATRTVAVLGAVALALVTLTPGQADAQWVRRGGQLVISVGRNQQAVKQLLDRVPLINCKITGSKPKVPTLPVLSGRFDADNYPALGATLQSLGVGQAQFFVNSVDTRTQGLDLTASHKMALGGGKLNTYLAMNFSKTDVTAVHAPSSLAGYEDVLLSEAAASSS